MDKFPPKTLDSPRIRRTPLESSNRNKLSKKIEEQKLLLPITKERKYYYTTLEKLQTNLREFRKYNKKWKRSAKN